MRRGNFVKHKEQPKAAIGVDLIENKQEPKRNVVEEVLTHFKKGHRDVNQAMKIIRDGEKGDKAGIS